MIAFLSHANKLSYFSLKMLFLINVKKGLIFKMRTILLTTFALCLSSTSLLAADSASGQIVFTGYVPGFVSGDSLIITGLGGDVEADYNATLVVNRDGTFTSVNPIILEARSYDQVTDPANPVIGDKVEASWEVASLSTLNPALAASFDDVELSAAEGSTITSSSLGNIASGQSSVTLSLTNDASIDGDIAGQEFSVSAILLVTAD